MPQSEKRTEKEDMDDFESPPSRRGKRKRCLSVSEEDPASMQVVQKKKRSRKDDPEAKKKKKREKKEKSIKKVQIAYIKKMTTVPTVVSIISFFFIFGRFHTFVKNILTRLYFNEPSHLCICRQTPLLH